MGIDCSLSGKNCQIEEKNGSICQSLTTEIHLIILKQTFGTVFRHKETLIKTQRFGIKNTKQDTALQAPVTLIKSVMAAQAARRWRKKN
jgi:hypothetical protein